ncbi:acyltransferase [Leptospira biflexa]|uniref:acyltransferase family protein n=2 Tax=Leptospira biflexa TaxID=172 RepID=UPI001090C518|nr:acyltransferase family protein [Leptospira biflexa]TGM44668.1 acyltransferase [Leptospira biflexa]TGM45445.1 acyltransferase [Leptospira biflexa]
MDRLHPASPLQMYRKEIDGLRAIAIIAVILNHIKHEMSPNGYLGVDLFFVISGYVISKSLLEKETTSFVSFLKQFWTRRVKRLLPALLFTVVVSVTITFLFSSHESHHTTMSIETGLFSLIGMGNLFLANMATDYFSTTAELNAFTHTWSLGVEEQFYLFFPILFWLFFHQKKRVIPFFIILSALTILSIFVYRNNFDKQPIKAFYFVHNRFWELSLGSLVFLISDALQNNSNQIRKLYQLTANVVLPFCLVSLLYFLLNPNAKTHPSINDTLLVSLLTSAILLSSHETNKVIGFLQWKPLQWIGLLSYSLYLWHWPVITFFRWTYGITTTLIPLILFLCFAFAMISYYWIETPARKKEWKWKHWNANGRFSPVSIGISSSIILILLIRLGLYPFYLNGKFFLGETANLESKGVHNLLQPVSFGEEIWDPNQCVLVNNKDLSKQISMKTCTLGKKFNHKRNSLVIGNSYSVAMAPMFQSLIESNSSVTITSSLGSAPTPNLSFTSKWENTSHYYWDQLIPELMKGLKPNDHVIMVFDINGLTDEVENIKLFQVELNNFISQLKAKKINLILQHTIPFMRDSNCTPDMAIKQWWHFHLDPPCHYFSKEETIFKRKPLTTALQELQNRHSNFYVLDLLDVFCPDTVCRFQHPNGQFLYRDEFSHPSKEASKLAKGTLLKLVESIKE